MTTEQVQSRESCAGSSRSTSKDAALAPFLNVVTDGAENLGQLPNDSVDLILTDCALEESEACDAYAHSYRTLKPSCYAVYFNLGQDEDDLLPLWLEAGFDLVTKARWMYCDLDCFCTVLVKRVRQDDAILPGLASTQLPDCWEETYYPVEAGTHEKLVEHFIREFSKPGEIVLDPFAGSGLVVSIAEKLHRRFIGIRGNSDLDGSDRLDTEN